MTDEQAVARDRIREAVPAKLKHISQNADTDDPEEILRLLVERTIGDEAFRRTLTDIIDPMISTGPFDAIDGVVMRQIMKYTAETLLVILEE